MTQANGSSDVRGLSEPVRRQRGWLSRVLLSLVLLVSGAVIGSGITLIAVVRVTQNRLQHPEEFPRRATHRLRSHLGLSDEQAAKVETILRNRQIKLQSLRREIQPRIEAQIGQLRDEIGAVLTPEQNAKWQRWLEDKRRTWIPPLPASADGP